MKVRGVQGVVRRVVCAVWGWRVARGVGGRGRVWGAVSPRQRVRVFSVVEQAIVAEPFLCGHLVEKLVSERGLQSDALLRVVLEHLGDEVEQRLVVVLAAHLVVAQLLARLAHVAPVAALVVPV